MTSSLIAEQTQLPINRFDARLAEELDQRTEFSWTQSGTLGYNQSQGINASMTFSHTS